MTNRHKIIPYLVIICGTIIGDWILGVLCVYKIIPLWFYLIFNIPFGGLYVWMKSSWVGTHYVMLGQNVGDLGSLFIFTISALSQAGLYCLLWYRFTRWNQHRHQLTIS
ncbi:MAG: hypothetical protein ACE14V_01980 [bacterium]